MPLHIQHSETLVFYDAPQVFVAKDNIGTHYLCLLTESSTHGQDNFLCIAISNSRILEFKRGKTDLRGLFEYPEIPGQWFVGVPSINNDLILESTDLNPEWLPEPGFFLEPDGNADGLIAQEAIEKQRPIIHFSLNPPESKDEAKISIQNLVIPLSALNRMLTHAYKKASKAFSVQADEIDALRPEVFAQSSGSFKIHIQAQPLEDRDVYGGSLIEQTMNIIYKMMELTGSENYQTDSSLHPYKGHLLSSYKTLLDYVVENSAPITLSFSMPHKIPVRNSVSVDSAKKMQMFLNERKELAVENVELTGAVLMADSRKGSWILQASDK